MLFFAILAAGTFVFLLASLLRRPRGPWTRRPAYLLAGLSFALVAMQSSLVRSDHEHILMGAYAMVFLGGAILLDEFNGPAWLCAALPATVVILTCVLAHPFPMFRPGTVATLVRRVVRPMYSCPAEMQEFDRACLKQRPMPRKLLGQGVQPGLCGLEYGMPELPIAVFPYQTALGLVSRRTVAGSVLQSYLIDGAYLSSLEVAGLERCKARHRPVSAGRRVEANRSVASLTSPEKPRGLVSTYLHHHRAAAGPGAPGVLGLLRDDTRDSRIHLSSRSIAGPFSTVRIRKRSTTVDLGTIVWPAGGADFLKLRLRLDYPFWWKVRKPSCLTLVMYNADGSQKPIQFVLRPGPATDIWVFPWDESGMTEYFSNDPADWHPRNRPALLRLQLLITPFDWISVVPNSVTVESIDAVQVSFL